MNTFRMKPRSQSGQVLVLGALCCLVLAVTVFTVLNVERRVHERIRLQNFSDERAYSLAVQEARSFNYFAYSNRAIAAGLVSMATLHAYMTEAAMTTDIDFGMFLAMMEIAGMEFDDCFCYWGLPLCFWHCEHGIEAIINGVGYIAKWISGAVKKNVQALDDPFKKAMQALDIHTKTLYYSQVAMVLAVDVLLGTTGKIGDLQDKSMGDPSIKSVSLGMVGAGIGLYNAYSFDKVVNMPSSPIGWLAYGTVDNTNDRQTEMTAVANGSRPGFTWDRGGLIGPPTVPNVLLTPTRNFVQGQAVVGSPSIRIYQTPNTGKLPPQAGGRSAVTSGTFPGLFGGMVYDADDNTVGNSIASFDWGAMSTEFHCHTGVAVLPMLAVIGPGELISSNSSLATKGSQANAAKQQALNDAINQLNGAQGQINDGDVRKHLSKSQLNDLNNQMNNARNQIKSQKSGGSSGDTRHRVDLGIPIGDPHDSVDHSQLSPDPSRFVDFQYDSNNADRFNQPVVYSAYRSDTRFNDVSNKPSPWEINGKVSIDLNGAKGQLDFTTTSTATAVSKAMVYYHRLGNWKEAPNFFNPYWRAKLESLDDTTELAALTSSAGLSGAAIATEASLYSKGAVNVKDASK